MSALNRSNAGNRVLWLVLVAAVVLALFEMRARHTPGSSPAAVSKQGQPGADQGQGRESQPPKPGISAG